ncbi:hypothetical protein QAD02_015198 [Eretmocerus hayati]|uniref:Uncharacterized protein n=1 Tax=Eretmocerus hayati TaxID=131215 RepID=A0ACC2P8S8_9HYME|nr:hypothetical protein QAD02_015198 [Eretmocerus hayati]
MEEDDETRLCRLCGNNARMVIDVFGDEGIKRFLAYKIQSKLNILIEPNDGLSHFACLQCSGSLEFFCDFYNECHKTQDDFETIAAANDKDEAPKGGLEKDVDSDKENVTPGESEKERDELPETLHISEKNENVTILHSNKDLTNNPEQTLCHADSPIDHSVEEKQDENIHLVSTTTILNEKFQDQALVDIEPVPHEVHCDSNTALGHEHSEFETPKLPNRRSRSTKNVKKNKNVEKKTPKSSTRGNTTKKSDKQSGKTIDKYFSTQTQSDKVDCNEENVNPNPAYTDNVANPKDKEQENVIFEGTVVGTNETSVVMPLKTERSNSDLRFENAEMAHGSEIVQAKNVVWLPDNSELLQPQRPISKNTNQAKNASPAPGDEAETTATNNTQTAQLAAGVDLRTCLDNLIVLEVQFPAEKVKDHTSPEIKRKRSISSSSSERKISEGKYAKISELMTDDQKKNIENHYTTDMSRVDQTKVDENVLSLDKCKYKCKICETIYPRLDKCQVHIWRHLEMKPYLCRICEFSTLTVSNIRCHIRKSHLKIKPFECHLCQKRYNSSTLLEEHLNIHTGSRPYQCEFCDFASTSKQVLVHHGLIHKSKKDVLCDICGKAFYSKGRMRAHKISHNKEKAFKCSLCSTYVLHQEALEKHYLNVHTKDYVCKICNKAYKSRKALHNHETVHSDAKFECPMCPNVYKSTHILREHILKHQGIRQYKCNACDKSFAQQSHLAAHMAVHSNITYNCPGCGKGFNRHDNMKAHTKRCELFLANPELVSLLPKRKISHSRNDTAKVATRKEENDELESNAVEKGRSRSRRSKQNDSLTDDSASPDEYESFIEKELSSEQY